MEDGAGSYTLNSELQGHISISNNTFSFLLQSSNERLTCLVGCLYEIFSGLVIFSLSHITSLSSPRQSFWWKYWCRIHILSWYLVFFFPSLGEKVKVDCRRESLNMNTKMIGFCYKKPLYFFLAFFALNVMIFVIL